MRVSVILVLSCTLLAGFETVASAEVIHLKNGRTIWADHVRQTDAQVEYDVGDDTYAIPKSLVDHIDAGGVSPAYASPGAKDVSDLPAFAPRDHSLPDSSLLEKVIRDGHPDDQALIALEQSKDPQIIAAGYFLAGKTEFERGDFPKARDYLDTALRFDGNNPSALNYYAALLAKTGHAPEALSYAERAVKVAPDSPDTLAILGYVQYAADRNQDAIQTLKHSLELRPDPHVKALLEKAERDAAVQTDYSERESNHFTLHYEGERTSDAFRTQLLAVLESHYEDLVRELGISPRNSIPVVLYTTQTFFDVTQAPSWSGAINDGKLRIPVQGLTSVTPQLAQVLKHELAHSFINQISAGRCPQWLNEGIAQLVEPKKISHGRELAELYRQQHEIPLNMLEGSFVRFSPAQAAVAYEESLAAAQFINESSGMIDLQRILERIGQGDSPEVSLRSILHSDYGQLEADLGKYLVDKYSN
jgi:Tetratricopeptide repeat